jgi:hypothetical protein
MQPASPARWRQPGEQGDFVADATQRPAELKSKNMPAHNCEASNFTKE